MPTRDGTGPMGNGPQTGRGFGPCASNESVAFYGRGMRMGRGRNCWNLQQSIPSLSEQKKCLELELQWINSQLESMAKETSAE